MTELVPGIPRLGRKNDVDGRDLCTKTRFALLPGHGELERVLEFGKPASRFAVAGVHRDGRGGGSVLDAKLGVDLFEVLVHSSRT